VTKVFMLMFDNRTEGSTMPLTEIEVDETPHNMDGLLLHGWDGSERVEAFISRRVMESWVDPREPYRKRRSLLRAQYNALGKLNLAAIERIAASKYRRGVAFNRQHPLWIFCCPTSPKAKRRSI
jgi:hypothetical protein